MCEGQMIRAVLDIQNNNFTVASFYVLSGLHILFNSKYRVYHLLWKQKRLIATEARSV